MAVCNPSGGPRIAWRRASVLAGAMLASMLATASNAQDVAEAARQEQSRKTTHKNSPRHVYTEEDLKKDKILTQEDAAKAAARKRQPEPAEESAQSERPADRNGEPESLGEVARRYRREKAAREAEEAAKKNLAPFPSYVLPQTSDAAPMPARPSETLVTPPRLSQRPREVPRTDNRSRVSPFQPRPLAPGPPLLRVPASNEKVVPSAPSAAPRATPALVGESFRKPEGNTAGTVQFVTVQRGESWWKLADRFLGSGARWEELRRLNPKNDGPAERLMAGSRVIVPSGKALPVVSTGAQEGAVKVEAGDSLWRIAREHLGRGSAWGCIASANPEIRDYRHLAVGSFVRLPDREETRGCPKPGANRLTATR